MRTNGGNYKAIRLLAQNINTELQPFVSAMNNIEGIMESIRSCVCDPASMQFLDKYYTDGKVLVDNIEFLVSEYIKLLTIVADELEFDAHMETWIPQDIGY